MERKVESLDHKLLYLMEEKLESQVVISIIATENLYKFACQSNNPILHVAENYEETFKIFIEAGAIIRILEYRPVSQYSYDSLKFLQKSIKIVQKYFPHNNVELADKICQYGWPLQHVILLRNTYVTKLMITDKYSSSINEKDGLGITALEVAIFSVDVENVKLLLNYNAKVNFENCFYYLYDCHQPFASTIERLKILKMLLDRVDGNSIIIKNKRRYDDLIHTIFRFDDKEVIKLMLQHERLLFTNSLKDTAIQALALNTNPGTIELLRGKKFNVNTRDTRKETPLILAARCHNVNAIEFLLDAGADIEAVNIENFSPLIFAIHNHSEKCVQLLLERGANALSVNNQRELPTVIDEIFKYKTLNMAGEIVLAHLALQKRLGTPINQVIRDKINSHDKLKTAFESNQELLSMTIFQSTTLFDLLTGNERRLERHVRNDEFVLKLQDFSKEIEKSYYFNNLLQKRLKNANFMVEMRTEGARCMCKLIEIDYNGFPDIADDIVSYLKLQDIKNLIEALS